MVGSTLARTVGDVIPHIHIIMFWTDVPLEYICRKF